MRFFTRLETRFQEISFLIFLLGTPLLVLGSLLYLNVDQASLKLWLGSGGAKFFRLAFETAGLSTFLIPVFFGNYLLSLIMRFEDIRQMVRNYDFHILKFSSFAFLFMITSVFLGVVEAYYSLDKVMEAGLGGDIGRSLGFALFSMFGIYGSLSVIALFLLAVTVLGGWFDIVGCVVAAMAFVASISSKVWSNLLSKSAVRIHKRSVSFDHSTHARFSESHVAQENTHSGIYLTGSQAVNAPQVIADETNEEVEVKKETKKKANLRAIVVSDGDKEANVKDEQANEVKKVSRKKKTEVEKNAEHATAEMNAEKTNEETDENTFQVDLKAFTKKYSFPSKSLVAKQGKIHTPSKKELYEKSRVIEERLSSFGVNGKVTQVHPGIRLTMFEYLPDSGVKLSKISGLGSDLALLLGAPSIRILAPIPGKTTVGIEVPNQESSMLSFASGLDALDKNSKSLNLPVVIGQDVSGKMHVSDLTTMPHMLVSGTTGSGKSVFVNTLINSLIYTKSPKDLRMIMVDPKMIELTPYNTIPHLAVPVISDVVQAKDALVWAEKEMDRRYQVFAEMGARNLESFNEKIKKNSKKRVEGTLGRKIDWDWEHMPYLVIVIDELADLMITQGKEVEIPITRIAQKARAAGIHLVLCTQRPSSDIVTGLIKTNFPTRLAFKVSSNIDSRTILDQSGAEKLLGNGDMLYLPNGKSILRLQGAFLSESDVNAVVASIS